MKWNHDDDGEIDRGSAPSGGFELPVRKRLTGIVVQAIVDAAQDADIGDRAIRADYGAYGHGACNVLPHEFERISGIDFMQGARRREIGDAA